MKASSSRKIKMLPSIYMPSSATREKKTIVAMLLMFFLIILVGTSMGQNCVVSITSLSNSTICAGSQVTLVATSNTLNATSVTDRANKDQINDGLNTHTTVDPDNDHSLTAAAYNSIASAISYSWSNGATTESIVVSPTITTNYSVIITSTTGCVGSSANKTINVNPLPIIGVADGKICKGQSFALIPYGASTYTFSSGPIVSPTVTTSYTVTGTSDEGCVGNDAVVTVSVHSVPGLALNAALSVVCVNQTTIALFATPVGGRYSGINVVDSVFSPIATGTFTPVYSYTNTTTGCHDSVSVSIIVDLCMGFDNAKNDSHFVELYPNPTNGVFTIRSNNNSLKSISITDVTGRNVLVAEMEGESNAFDLSGLAGGVYYVVISSTTSREVIKLIKE